ncbi:hypothetical protein RBSWK_05526 [Rhodopirellula baltica SWK14]|uniref:Uncharacterized protein n=1 Tax=Rhodopirellula baltica SWK14 TaxID=993516 RepID=L7C8R7_RHOBT|nr:hypothetical protein RBSWK_05526 [Rhodopirellula baltica SWK14]
MNPGGDSWMGRKSEKTFELVLTNPDRDRHAVVEEDALRWSDTCEKIENENDSPNAG